ncbi:hypothetical protein Tco_0195052 [Tanacetum coccineum]
MMTLKFADTHNMVAFLSKPTESDGFEQIVDFLNAHPIREEQLHALVDGKKIIITKSSVRRYLQLADEEGVDCLPNSTIFEQLTLMGIGYVKTKVSKISQNQQETEETSTSEDKRKKISKPDQPDTKEKSKAKKK